MLPPVHRYNDACRRLEALLEKTPDDAEALTLLGRCQIAMSRSEKAVASLQRAIECSADEVDAYYFLAIALRFRLKRPGEADIWMDRMIAANPNSAVAHRYMSNYLLTLKADAPDPKGAQHHAEAALKLDPDNNALLSLAAQAGLAGGNFEAARRYAERGLEIEKDSPAYREMMYRILADIQRRSKNLTAALALLQKAFSETKNPQLLWLEADLQCDRGDPDGAAATVEKLAALKFNKGGLDYLRGRIDLRRGKWSEASKALENALHSFADKPDVLKRLHCWLGVCYGRLGNAEEQIAAFRRALAIDPKFEPAQKALAEALQNAEKLKDALPKDRQAGKESLAILAKVYLADNHWEKAREILRKLAEDYPEDPQCSSSYARELLGHDELGDAETIVRKMEEKWPHDSQTILPRAELLLRRDKAEEAFELMKNFVADPQGTPSDSGRRMQSIARGMEDFAGRLALAGNAAVKDRLLHAAETYLRQCADAHPPAAVELAAFLARQKRYADAADFLEKNWRGCEPTALATVCFQVAQEGRGPKEIFARMLTVLGQGRNYFHDPAAITLILGNLQTGAGNYAAAEKFFREALQKHPDHALALNNLAALLTMERKNLPEALELIEKAIKIAGPLGPLLDTRACVYVAQGEAQKALDDLSQALADARTAERLFHQAEAYELAGRKELAAKAMKEALAKGLDEKKLSPERSRYSSA